MSLSLIFLLALIAMGVGLAVLLVRCSCETNRLPDSKTLEAEIARLENYRFIGQSDGQSGAEQRRLMRRQLMALRQDFLRFWCVCRSLAPYAQDPDFGTMLVKQLVFFYCLWGPLWIGSYGWAFEHAIGNFTKLVNSVKRLRTCAHGVIKEVEKAAFEAPVS